MYASVPPSGLHSRRHSALEIFASHDHTRGPSGLMGVRHHSDHLTPGIFFNVALSTAHIVGLSTRTSDLGDLILVENKNYVFFSKK